MRARRQLVEAWKASAFETRHDSGVLKQKPSHVGGWLGSVTLRLALWLGRGERYG